MSLCVSKTFDGLAQSAAAARHRRRTPARRGINRKVVTSSSHKTRVSWAILPMPGMRNRSPRVISAARRPTWNCKELKISRSGHETLPSAGVCDDKAHGDKNATRKREKRRFITTIPAAHNNGDGKNPGAYNTRKSNNKLIYLFQGSVCE
jgi:hypothetical protein